MGPHPHAFATATPRNDPNTPTMTFARIPIWALVRIRMLASQPTTPPMMRVTKRFVDAKSIGLLQASALPVSHRAGAAAGSSSKTRANAWFTAALLFWASRPSADLRRATRQTDSRFYKRAPLLGPVSRVKRPHRARRDVAAILLEETMPALSHQRLARGDP